MVKITIGDYPPEYKPEVHGPYDPARYYGKPDTPFGQVKLGELGAWFSRRKISPVSIWHACSRACWRWDHKYKLVKYTNGVHVLQVFVALQVMYTALTMKRKLCHRQAKYH